MTQLFFEHIEMGKQIPCLVKKVDLLQLLRYAAATWNFYLLHLEKELARNRGLRDVNIPAPFYGAMLATMISCWTEDPRNLRKLTYSVKVMGFPGDTLSAKGRVVRKYQETGKYLVDCDVWVKNQDGVKVALGSTVLSSASKKTI